MNGKVQFGTHNDLQIYHSGTESWIRDVGLSDLFLDTNGSKISVISDGSYANGKMADFVKDGAVTLYYDNAVKVATTATGIDVTGTITADGLDLGDNSVVNVGTIALDIIKGDADDNTNITFAGSDTTTFNQGGTQRLSVNTTGITVTGAVNTTAAVGQHTVFNSTGADADFRVRTGATTHSLYVEGNTGNVGVGTSSPVSKLNVGTANATAISISTPFTTGNYGDLVFTTEGTTTYNARIRATTPGDGTRKLEFITAKSATENTVLTLDGDQNATFSGEVSTTNAKLKAIAKDISDTAVDVFVYDTRKDSDGGAWRKRTQNTSWYNEALNTATRGARKEFPSVAVIVLTNATLKIYDGDDPSLPLWMRWTNNNLFSNTPKAVKMLNGLLVVASNHTSVGYAQKNLITANFITEEIGRSSHAGAYGGTYHGGLYYRESLNNQLDWSGDNPYALVSYELNDVAITVLPNAPIDADTGLPVPTIVVATEGGASLIKDDGTVVSLDLTTSSLTIDSISFTKDTAYIAVAFGGNTATPVYVYNIRNTWALSGGHNIAQVSHDGGRDSYILKVDGDSAILESMHEDFFATGTPSGLSKFNVINDTPQTTTGNNVFTFITSDYNTGWMVGDTKLATLSDTDTTNACWHSKFTNGFVVTGWTTRWE